ncbi:hypothetical protein C7T94_09150 [Pedobacter yulinensis]|uniref:Uncharacterized protein n=1 Tax=Pedobacter yulinensis TaxID=2126353 RepID=A0A2T3HK54_9SPHI|nr:hypothetical protein C7T94_09150 [Pedobacter yulinensis]
MPFCVVYRAPKAVKDASVWVLVAPVEANECLGTVAGLGRSGKGIRQRNKKGAARRRAPKRL